MMQLQYETLPVSTMYIAMYVKNPQKIIDLGINSPPSQGPVYNFLVYGAKSIGDYMLSALSYLGRTILHSLSIS